MQFLFVHSGEVSLREQICTQVYLGIATGELRPGERLPSTRAMARRFDLHPNTVSTAYQQLQQEGLVEQRKGSGIFVRTPDVGQPPDSGNRQLDLMIAGFLTAAREQGFTLDQVTERARRWLEVRPPDHFLVVEPESERLEIVLAELRACLRLPVRGCTTAECADAQGCIALALPSKVAEVCLALPAAIELITLRVTTVPPMRQWVNTPEDALVGIVSRWPEFVRIARTMLIATGFSPDRLVDRVRDQPGWAGGLQTTAAVLCDAATAPLLGPKVRSIVFGLVSEEVLDLLRTREAEITRQLNAANGPEPSVQP